MSDIDQMDIEKAKDLESASNKKSMKKHNKTMNKNKKKKKSRKRKILDEKDAIKDEPAKKRRKKKKRGWSSEEEKLFAEALELYGRDWQNVAKHVGNHRDAASIRSHAQIYFLRLLQTGTSLPNKLLETGNGYTLSGKPLNKYSVVAIRHFNGAENVPMVDGVISDQENVATKKRRKKNKKSNKKSKQKYYDSSSDDESQFEEYEINPRIITKTTDKVRRSGRNKKKFNSKIKNDCIDPPHISNPFGLRTDIEIYDEMILKSEDTKNKSRHNHKIYAPFKIIYCPNALLIADIHSHLLRSVEIMGLLGGTYDYDNRILFIKKCYPLIEEQQNEETVIANSLQILTVSEEIKNKDNLQLVGWYHSHPCFENVPSNLDCHQHSMNKYENEKKQPYVGLIVQSLWNTHNNYSHFRWFNTKLLNKDNKNDYQYIALEFDAKTKIFNSLNGNDEVVFTQISQLIKRYNQNKYDIYRTDFGENEIGKKILDNIQYHLKNGKEGNENDEQNDDDNEMQIFIKKIEKLFVEKNKIWWVTNRPQISNNNDSDNSNNRENKNV